MFGHFSTLCNKGLKIQQIGRSFQFVFKSKKAEISKKQRYFYLLLIFISKLLCLTSCLIINKGKEVYFSQFQSGRPHMTCCSFSCIQPILIRLGVKSFARKGPQLSRQNSELGYQWYPVPASLFTGWKSQVCEWVVTVLRN